MGEAFVATPHRHKLPTVVRTFSLRSGVVMPRLRSSTPRRRCAFGCTSPGDAQPRRYAPRHRQRYEDITTHRLIGITTHRHKPRPIPQARRGGTQLRSGYRGGRLCKAERSFRINRKPLTGQQPTVSQRLLWPRFSVGLHCSAFHHRPVAPATSTTRIASTATLAATSPRRASGIWK